MKLATWTILILMPTLALAEPVRQTMEIEMSAKGIHCLELICGAGSLALTGIEELDTIRVKAQIELEGLNKDKAQAFIEENLRLDLKKRNDFAVLRSEFKQAETKGMEARINLSVEVPVRLDVKITDGSGPIRVREISGNLEIDDGSGNIEIETVEGEVTVNDGSGSMVIEDILGRVWVRDGSGSVEIYHIEDDVVVTDGSGEITIRHIDGNVTVTDGSGDLTIEDVTGNVFIIQAGSGELDIEQVDGKVTTRE